MDAQHRDWNVQRLNEAKTLRAKAPIAAQYEDCMQSFDRLRASLRARLPDHDTRSLSGKDDFESGLPVAGVRDQSSATRHLFVLAENCVTDFIIWGNEAGAVSRALDHALRRSNKLSTTVLQHLEALHGILFKGKCDPLELPAAEEVVQQHGQNDDGDASTDTGCDDAAHQDFEDSDSEPEDYLEFAADVITDLKRLLPSLRDPERDDFVGGLAQSDTSFDAEIARMMFPNAPPFLIKRLANANTQRRQRMTQKAAYQGIRVENEDNKFFRSFGYSSKPPEMPPPLQARPSNNGKAVGSPRRYKRTESIAGISTVASMLDSVFSGKPVTASLYGTSIADSVEPIKVPTLKPPRVPTGFGAGNPVPCPLCSFDIPFSPEINLENYWTDHFYLDLEPYICTAEACDYPSKTYGKRHKWADHVLSHLQRRVWACRHPACMKEFATQALFLDHIQSSHDDGFGSSDASLVLDDLKGLSLTTSNTHKCPLCVRHTAGLEEHIHHLAGHLEEYSLFAYHYKENSDDSEPEEEAVEVDDDSAEMLLASFVKEQATIVDHRRQEAWAKIREGTNLKRHGTESKSVSDISSMGRDEVGNIEPRTKTGAGEWHDRVENFFQKQVSPIQPSPSGNIGDITRCNLPPQNLEFLGRDSDLDVLHEVLKAPGQVCSLSGPGGVGKTSTAIEYAHRFGSEYPLIFWVEAETPGGCAEKYAAIARHVINDTTLDKRGQGGLISMTKEYLKKTRVRWLLILDNADDWNSISGYVPRNMTKTQGSVLITSRDCKLFGAMKVQPKNIRQVTLKAFSLSESARFLLCGISPAKRGKDLTRDPDYKLAIKASELVGRLPLAIGMIAGYVRVSRSDLVTFLESWEEREESMMESGRISDPTAFDPAIDALWDIGISEVPRISSMVLNIVSFFDPEKIQKDLLIYDGGDEPLLTFLNPKEKVKHKRMMDQLIGRKLIAVKEIQDGEVVYCVHRLLQEKILKDMSDAPFAEAFQRAFCLLRQRFPPASVVQVPEPDKWEVCANYMPHVFSIHQVYTKSSRVTPTMELARLFYDAGFHVWERQSDAHEGLSFLKTAEQILDDIQFDPDGSLRAEIHCCAGLLYSGMGCSFRNECWRRQEEALEIRKTVHRLNPDDRISDILLQNSASDLAFTQLMRNQFQKASVLFESCLQRYREWDSENVISFEYAKYYLNSGYVLMWEGRFPESIKSLEKSIQLAGLHSTKTRHYIQSRFTLGCVLLQAGEVQKALEIQLEVLKTRLELNGEHDQSTIFSTYAVGTLYHQLGSLPTAVEYMVECIECAKSSFFPEEALGRAQLHLSRIYKEQGLDNDETRALEAKGLKVLAKYSQYVSKGILGVEDDMVAFDDLQSIFDGRFTGTRLLKWMQAGLSQPSST